MKNCSFWQILCIFSAIIGAIIGVLPLIPALTSIAFTILMFFIAPFVILYFRKLKLIKTIEIEKWMIVGAVSGAVATIGFTVLYFPIALILQLIFKIQSFIWIKVLFTNIGYLIPMVLLTALISALLNAFSSFLLAYFMAYFNQNKQ